MTGAQPPRRPSDVDRLLQIYNVERSIEGQTFSTLLTMLSTSTALLTLSAFALFHAKHAVPSWAIQIHGFDIHGHTSETGEVPGWAVALVPIPTLPFIVYTAILTYLGNVRALVVRDYEEALRPLLRAPSTITPPGPPFGQEATRLVWRRLRLLIPIAFIALLGLYGGIIVVSYQRARTTHPWIALSSLVGCSVVTALLVVVLILAFAPKRSRTNPAPDLEKPLRPIGRPLIRLMRLLRNPSGTTFEEELRQREESLWREDKRFDRGYMESILAADFVEFGRSGRVFTRAESVSFEAHPIGVRLPLEHFAVHRVTSDTYLVSYVSRVTVGTQVELANRSSLWLRTAGGWKLRFHQGTPRAEA